MRKHVTKLFIVFIAIGVICATGLYVYFYMQKPSYLTQLRAIEMFTTSSTLRDFTGTYNVKSADDVGFKLTSKNKIIIIFGNVQILLGRLSDVPPEDIVRFEKIGIEFYYDKSNKLHMTYRGQETCQYAN